MDTFLTLIKIKILLILNLGKMSKKLVVFSSKSANICLFELLKFKDLLSLYYVIVTGLSFSFRLVAGET